MTVEKVFSNEMSRDMDPHDLTSRFSPSLQTDIIRARTPLPLISLLATEVMSKVWISIQIVDVLRNELWFKSNEVDYFAKFELKYK